MPYWGIFPFRLRVIDLHGATWPLPLTGCTLRQGRVCYLSWSPSGASLEPFSQTRIFWYFYVIMLLLPGDVSLMFGFDSVVDVDEKDHTFDDRWSNVVRFLAYSTSDSILGHILVLVEVYGSSWICMLVPTYRIHAETMTCSLSYHDPPVESLQSHLVRPALFIVWMSLCFFF